MVTSGLPDDSGIFYCPGGKVVSLSNDMISCAMNYFYLKTSAEVKKFQKLEKYENITKSVDGILYYVGRILENYTFDGYPELCGAAIDLCRTTFCVPVMEQYSPVAISISMEIHWHHQDVKHRGIESMLRQSLKVAHIMGGRELTKSVKRICKRCRIMNKNSIGVVMGPSKMLTCAKHRPFLLAKWTFLVIIKLTLLQTNEPLLKFGFLFIAVALLVLLISVC